MSVTEKAADTVVEEEGGQPMTFWEHLEELRKRLLWSVITFFIGCLIAWEFHQKLFAILTAPFEAAWTSAKLTGQTTLHFGSPGAAFTAYFQLSMIGGAVLASPFIFYQVWSFVAPGLYAREKRYVIPFVFFSTALFVGGGYFGWKIAFPITFDYFLGLAGPVSEKVAVTPTVMMGEYIDFTMKMLLGFGLVFELPLLLLFLSIAGLVNYLQLISFGRYFILLAFVVAAVFTPPDMFSQLAMAVPMCLLYGVSIGLVRLFGKPPTEEQKKAFLERKKKNA